MEDDENGIKKYNPKSHKVLESNRVKKDILMADIILKYGDNKLNYISVEKKEDVYTMIYNPVPDPIPNLEWVIMDANISNAGGKLYKSASNNRVIWKFKAVKTNLTTLFKLGLKSWFDSYKFKNNTIHFVKDVVSLMTTYQHVECEVYSQWLHGFCNVYTIYERDDIGRTLILEEVIKQLGSKIFYKKELEAFKNQDELFEAILTKSAILTFKDCSNKCHKQFSKFNPKIENSNRAVLSILKRGREAMQKASNDIINEPENTVVFNDDDHKGKKTIDIKVLDEIEQWLNKDEDEDNEKRPNKKARH